MRVVAAIAFRELGACFRTPLGWVVIALYLLLSGLWVAFATLRPGEPATLRDFFAFSQWVLLTVAPAISMRLISDEYRTGTIEPLTTSPVTDYHIAFGKFLGSVAFLLCMLLPTLLYVGLLETVADPDYGPILAGYLGLLLAGSLYLAAGLFFSSLTSSPVVAFLGTVFFFIALMFISGQGAARLGEPWSRLLFPLSISMRIGDFAKGVIDLGHVAAFACASAWFVLMTSLVLESRRWR